MSLKPLGSVPVPVTLDGASITAIQVQPKMKSLGLDAEQKTSTAGQPLWVIDALASFPTGEVGTLSVTVPSAQKPNATGFVRFEGLRVGHWNSDSGRGGGMYWQAEAVAVLKGGE